MSALGSRRGFYCQLLMEARTGWANHLQSPPCHLISAAKTGSLVHSLACSLAAPNTHEPIWHRERERERFPFLTPITHEVLIPYDGCQSPAVYISTTLRHPLIFLSSILVITVTFFFFFFLRAPGNQISRCFQYGLSDLRMYGWMYGWMQGFASWWTGNMILQLCWESRICASFDCLGREGKGNRGGKRGGELH